MGVRKTTPHLYFMDHMWGMQQTYINVVFIHVTRPVFFWFLCGGKERRHQPLDLPVNDPAFTAWQNLYNQYDPVVPYFYYVS